MSGADAEKMYKDVGKYYYAMKINTLFILIQFPGKEIFARGGLAKISSLSTSNSLYDVANYENILKSIVGGNVKLNSVTYPYVSHIQSKIELDLILFINRPSSLLRTIPTQIH